MHRLFFRDLGRYAAQGRIAPSAYSFEAPQLAAMNVFRASAISTAVLIGASFLPRNDVAHEQRRSFELTLFVTSLY
jgi:hypothetical protein